MRNITKVEQPIKFKESRSMKRIHKKHVDQLKSQKVDQPIKLRESRSINKFTEQVLNYVATIIEISTEAKQKTLTSYILHAIILLIVIILCATFSTSEDQ